MSSSICEHTFHYHRQRNISMLFSVQCKPYANCLCLASFFSLIASVSFVYFVFTVPSLSQLEYSRQFDSVHAVSDIETKIDVVSWWFFPNRINILVTSSLRLAFNLNYVLHSYDSDDIYYLMASILICS